MDDVEQRRLNNLFPQIFENRLILETIVKHAVMKFTHAGQVCRRSQVKKLRLVNKSWMRAVSGALRKEREPVFCLVLKKENSVLGSLAPEFENNGKLLHQFLRKWAEDAQLENGGSPFSLNIQPEFFLQENAQDLSTCLRSYGRNLMNLDVSFPLNGSMLFDFDSLSLEKLQILGVQFPYMPLVDASVQSSNMHTNGHTLALLRGLLEGAKELKEFQFPRCIPNGMRPLKFDEVTLSKSISRLTIDCPLQSKDLRVLLHNEFTNLSYLKLFATEQAYDNGIMYQILSRVKDSLKDLHLWGQKYGRRARNTTPVRFPLMKKLEKLIMTSQCWDLDNSTCMHQSGWHIQLPKLNDLVIRHITRTTLEKWTSQARYQSVEKLAVSLIDTSVPRINRTYEQTRTLPRSVMRKINLAFPNLVCLEMSVGEPGTLGLQYVFKEMHNLQKLAIVLVRENNSVYTNSVFWDRLLIGAPNGLESFKTFNSIDDENRPSIRKLTALRVLTLADPWGPCNGRESSLISDVVFHHALFKMPNLKHVIISGSFKVSSSMREQWAQEKGTYINGLRLALDNSNNITSLGNSSVRPTTVFLQDYSNRSSELPE